MKILKLPFAGLSATCAALFAVLPSLASAQPDGTPILLRATAFVTGECGADLAIEGIESAGIPALDTPAFMDQMRAHLGKPLSQALLLEILATTNRQLDSAGRGFTLATLPAQDVRNGTLCVKIVQGKAGQIRIRQSEDSPFPEDHYRRLLRIKPGDVLDRETLEADTDWINRSNPYRSAAIIARPGQGPGETDLDLVVTDKRPWGLALAFDNTGTRFTGRNRITLSAGRGNLFGLDHQVNYTLNADPGFDHYVSHNLGYVIPLPWRHLLSLSAATADIHARLPVPFDLKGTSRGFSVRYDVPLKSLPHFSHGLNAGLDFKRSDNNLLFSRQPVTNTKTGIRQLTVGYSATLNDRHGRTVAGLSWTHSPGSDSGTNSDAAFSAARFGAKARYNYQSLVLDRVTHLPADWAWTVNLRVQRADGNLLGSEQLAGGGVASVRGFSEALAFGDQGHVLRTELLTPVATLGSGNQLQAALYYDEARLRNKRKLPGERNAHLSAVGISLRTALQRHVSAKIDFGKTVETDAPGANSGSHVHFSITTSF